jgi:hypothetical protein
VTEGRCALPDGSMNEEIAARHDVEGLHASCARAGRDSMPFTR